MKIALNRLRAIIAEEVDGQQDDQAGSDMAMSRAERTARWQSKRPDISHLLPGTADEDGEVVPLFHVGDRIVVDRKAAAIAGNPWLDTLIGRVKGINTQTGVVTIVDDDSDPRAPRLRYVNYKDGMHQVKLAPTKGDPFDPGPAAAASQPAGTSLAPSKASKATYRIYGKLGQHLVHTRLKGQAYYAPPDTKFHNGDQARIEPRDGKLAVKNVAGDHEQLWEPE